MQWEQNGGKCGICGDPYQLEEPRPHEAGGLYAKGIITRHYAVGQHIDVEVELTANHYGRFEMFLCPNNNYKQEATQECFDRYPLYIAGTSDFRYNIGELYRLFSCVVLTPVGVIRYFSFLLRRLLSKIDDPVSYHGSGNCSSK